MKPEGKSTYAKEGGGRGGGKGKRSVLAPVRMIVLVEQIHHFLILELIPQAVRREHQRAVLPVPQLMTLHLRHRNHSTGAFPLGLNVTDCARGY